MTKEYCRDSGVELPSKNGWIKCSERLPAIGKQVLTYCDNHPTMPIIVNYLHNYENEWVYHCTKNITHWMPLPSTPE